MVGQRQGPTRAHQAEFVVGQHLEPEIDLRLERVEGEVEGLLGDRELGDGNGKDPAHPPHEQGQRSLDGQDLDDADPGQHLVGDHHGRGRVEHRLQGREGRQNPQAFRDPVSCLELVGGVDLDAQLDGLIGRTCETRRARGPFAAVILAASVRVSVAGLYWNTMTVPTGLNADTVARAPLNTGGAS